MEVRRQESCGGPSGLCLSAHGKTEGKWAGFRFSLEEESTEPEHVFHMWGEAKRRKKYDY